MDRRSYYSHAPMWRHRTAIRDLLRVAAPLALFSREAYRLALRSLRTPP